jgi:hypothetical protein
MSDDNHELDLDLNLDPLTSAYWLGSSTRSALSSRGPLHGTSPAHRESYKTLTSLLHNIDSQYLKATIPQQRSFVARECLLQLAGALRKIKHDLESERGRSKRSPRQQLQQQSTSSTSTLITRMYLRHSHITTRSFVWLMSAQLLILHITSYTPSPSPASTHTS